MLQQMRDMKMFVFWFVAIAFVVGFVFFGGLDVPKLGRSQVEFAGVINGEKINYEAYSRYVTQLAELERQRYQREHLSTADYDRLESQAWDDLISNLLVRQEAQRLGVRAQDEEIVGALTQNPPSWVRQRFTDESGKFDAASFQAALNDPNYNWGPDEQALRNALPAIKLEKLVRARASVSEGEVRAEFARRRLRTKARYVGVPVQSIDLGSWTPGDAEVRAYYDQHPEQFTRGETVTLEVIRVEKKPSPTDETDALDDARQILDEEKRGETFAALVEIYSDDPTAARGGDLGWVAPASLPPALRDAAATLAPGATSEPVRSDRGLYILHADSIRAGSGGREVRLRQILLVPKLSSDTLDSLRTRVLEAQSSAQKDFAGTALALGVAVQSLEPIENKGFIPGIGFAKRLVDWAFAAAPGAVSEAVGTDDAMLIARLVSKQPKAPRTFEEVREQARALALEAARKARARERMERLLAQVQAGATLDQAAKAAGLVVQEPAPFSFYESVPDVGGANEFTAVAGTLEPGRTSGVVETARGAYLLQVVSRDPFDEQAYQSGRASEYQSMLSQREEAAYTAWLKELRERAKIEDRRRPSV